MQRIFEEGRSALQTTADRTILPPSHDFWLDEEIETFFSKMRIARRVAYLAVRAAYDPLRGLPRSLDRAAVRYRIDRSSERWDDFQTWSREVVWYGNKKGAYLYGNRAVQAELAGNY